MKILDQIKANAVPVGTMRTAARGALPLPAVEMLEILIYLTQNPLFALDAKMTLAGWEVGSAVEVVSNPAAPPDVLGYFWAPSNRRPSLMPAMIENPAITESMLIELAATGGRDMVKMLLASPRARSSPAVSEALAANPEVAPEELQALKEATPAEMETPAGSDEDAKAETAHRVWHEEHAAEIAAEEGKPFELTGEDEDEHPDQKNAAAATGAQSSAPDSSSTMAAMALSAGPLAQAAPSDDKQLSLLQRIAKMSPGQRVKMAFGGGRDERMILIRDGAKVVQNAVLASPRLTEPEVESFASAKNVSENVLRQIARDRRFMRNYNVGRNLVNNAKCPLDLSLTLIRNLMVFDLKSLRFNKSVPDTIRQVAAKLYREKTEGGR